MANIAYMENEFKYLDMESDKKEYLKGCYADIIKLFKLENTDNITGAYRIGIVFSCINEFKDDFDKLIEKSSEKLCKCVSDDDDEEQRNENKITIEILAVIYKITKEEEFTKYSIDLDKFLEWLYRLLAFKPLTPLYGTDDEWIPDDPKNITCYLNKRFFAVTCDINKENPVDMGSKIYTNDNGNSWYSSNVGEPITFPYEVPTVVEKIYLENYVKDIYGPSIIVNSKFAKEKKEGTPKYAEYCLGFLPSSSEGQYNSNDFKAKYALLLRVYDPMKDKIISYDIISITDTITRENAIKAFEELKSKVLEDNTEINGNPDLKELF